MRVGTRHRVVITSHRGHLQRLRGPSRKSQTPGPSSSKPPRSEAIASGCRVRKVCKRGVINWVFSYYLNNKKWCWILVQVTRGPGQEFARGASAESPECSGKACKNITMLISCCTTVLLLYYCNCTTLQLYNCTTVLLCYYCATVVLL